METKQVIVIRTDLKNTKGEKVRSGKLLAQVAHASIAWITNRLREGNTKHLADDSMTVSFNLTLAEWNWSNGIFKKIVCTVDSEADLRDIHQKALDAGLRSYFIEDHGLTEFGGILTPTCVGIGPDTPERIDPVTRHLKLG